MQVQETNLTPSIQKFEFSTAVAQGGGCPGSIKLGLEVDTKNKIFSIIWPSYLTQWQHALNMDMLRGTQILLGKAHTKIAELLPESQQSKYSLYLAGAITEEEYDNYVESKHAETV